MIILVLLELVFFILYQIIILKKKKLKNGNKCLKVDGYIKLVKKKNVKLKMKKKWLKE